MKQIQKNRIDKRISLESRYKLKKDIERLETSDLYKVFRIIQEHNIHYSTNKNGVFININSIDDSIIFLLQKFVDFCKKKNHTLEHYESFITPKILPEKEYKEYNFIETKWETKQTITKPSITSEPIKIKQTIPKLSGISALLVKQCKSIESS